MQHTTQQQQQQIKANKQALIFAPISLSCNTNIMKRSFDLSGFQLNGNRAECSIYEAKKLKEAFSNVYSEHAISTKEDIVIYDYSASGEDFFIEFGFEGTDKAYRLTDDLAGYFNALFLRTNLVYEVKTEAGEVSIFDSCQSVTKEDFEETETVYTFNEALEFLADWSHLISVVTFYMIDQLISEQGLNNHIELM